MFKDIFLKGIIDSLYFPNIKKILIEDEEMMILIKKFIKPNIILIFSIIYLNIKVPNLIFNYYPGFNITIYNYVFLYLWYYPLFIFSFINNLNYYNKIIILYSERVEIKRSSFVYQLSNLIFFQFAFLLSNIILELFLYIPYIGFILYSFFYVMITSYYCYDFRCCVYDINYTDRIKYFENNWLYFFGYGFIFLIIKILFDTNYHFLLRDICMFYLIIRSIFIDYPKKIQDKYHYFSINNISIITDYIIVFIFKFFNINF
jgi:hypothetical protein